MDKGMVEGCGVMLSSDSGRGRRAWHDASTGCAMATATMAVQVTGNRGAQLLDMAWKCHVPTGCISARHSVS